MKPRSALLALASLAIAGGLALWLRASASDFEDQINNLETFKSYKQCLDDTRARLGLYPSALNDLRECFRYGDVRLGEDWWGNPLQFESDGTRFVLVSLGRDGAPDGLDPWSLRLVDPKAMERTCGNPEADQVMSDRGFHRACTK
jgi:hypothetical protein